MEEIIIKWAWQDVQEFNPRLDKEECCQVLESVLDNHDCNYGINWDVINDMAFNLFAEKAG